MTRQRRFFIISFFLIFFFGIVVRLSNISPHNIYPDAYQSLIVAMNIATYQSVVGLLGNQGMLYPDFFAWSRPGFPLAILLTSFLTNNLTTAAHIVTIVTSISSLILAYFLGKILFSSKTAGICMMALLAFSFNHTVWSGFILTEALAVFLMLSFLLAFFYHVPKRWVVVMTGIRGLLFSLLILTRYEYVLILFPLLYFARVSEKYSRLETLYFIITVGVYLLLAGFFLYPFPDTLYLFLYQTQDLLQKSGILLGIIFLCLSIFRFLPHHSSEKIRDWFPNIFLSLLWLTTFYLLLQIGFPSLFSLFADKTASIRNFLYDDVLLSSMFLLGVTLMVRNKLHTTYLIFSLVSIFVLYAVYFRTNPAMERYITHLIPFMLIPAAFALSSIETLKKTLPYRNVILALFLGAFFFQGINTWIGIREWGDKSWFSISYDERAAALTRGKIAEKDTLLLVSFPEPYFYVTRLSTHSITDTYPYVYIPEMLADKEIIISEDMGMRDIFPTFTSFLEKNMQDRKIDSFYVHLPYHYADYSKKETKPVILYKTTVKELKKRIQKAKM